VLYSKPTFLDRAGCGRIRAAMDVGSPEAAEVLEEGVEIRSDTRRASLIDVDADVTAAVEAGFDRERAAISTFFGVDLVSREGTGFLRYRPGDFYRPHRDRASLPSWPAAIHRRVALVLFLNGPDDFDGGILRLYIGKRPIAVTPSAGLLVAFPADVLHEVTPVRRGTRDAVVDWFYDA
jgi:predicted 2-oxoglutarate/Fe(II)-dependent dioxygenase YbiX